MKYIFHISTLFYPYIRIHIHHCHLNLKHTADMQLITNLNRAHGLLSCAAAPSSLSTDV